MKPSPEAPFVPLDRSGIAVVAGADLLLLDEFSPESLATLVRMLSPQAEALPARASIVLEASGRNPADLKLYAKTGVDLNMRFALSQVATAEQVMVQSAPTAGHLCSLDAPGHRCLGRNSLASRPAARPAEPLHRDGGGR